MLKTALLGAALLAAVSNANPHLHIRQNSSSLSSSIIPISYTPSISLSSSSASSVSPSTALSATSSQSSAFSSSTSLHTFSDTTKVTTSTSVFKSSTLIGSSSVSNITSSNTANVSAPAPTGPCTGCVLEAFQPTTLSFEKSWSSTWTSVVVTETIVTVHVTYFDSSTIDTVVTEYTTLNQTKTVLGPANETIILTTPVFTWKPAPSITITLDAGPTYVAYPSLWGGLDRPAETDQTAGTGVFTTQAPDPSCKAEVAPLAVKPDTPEDYHYFIETYVDSAPTVDPYGPVLLPPRLLEYLEKDPQIFSIFYGANLATCTLAPTYVSAIPEPPKLTAPAGTTRPGQPYPSRVHPTVPVNTPAPTITTGTYISTSYESTSQHVTRQGCLRCSTPQIVPPAPTEDPKSSQDRKPPPDTPRPIDPPPTRRPEDPQKPNVWTQEQPSYPGQTITIGGSGIPVRPVRPTDPGQSNIPNPPNPGIVIGSETLAPGQTTTINGVPVVVPTYGGGTRVVIDGSTVAIAPIPTGPPALTVDGQTVTANSQGQFVFGTQTLNPGGPAITINGNTLSLGTSGSIAVVNGVTSTLNWAGVPVLTINGQTITGSVASGTTAFVLGPGRTLVPGTAITISGTTYSMPESASGSVIVINGVTSTLGQPPITAAAALTIDGKTYSATVRDGTTEYVLAPGTTLKPGDAITVSGTTYSLDPKGTALIINGQTSSIPKTPVSNSATTTQSHSSGESSSTASPRDPGNFIASGIGISSQGAAVDGRRGGLDKTIEGMLIGMAGWILMFV